MKKDNAGKAPIPTNFHEIIEKTRYIHLLELKEKYPFLTDHLLGIITGRKNINSSYWENLRYYRHFIKLSRVKPVEPLGQFREDLIAAYEASMRERG